MLDPTSAFGFRPNRNLSPAQLNGMKGKILHVKATS